MVCRDRFSPRPRIICPHLAVKWKMLWELQAQELLSPRKTWRCFHVSDGKPSLTSPSVICSKPLTPTKHFILFAHTCTHTCAHARGSQKGMSGLLEQGKYLLNKHAYLSSASQHSCKQWRRQEHVSTIPGQMWGSWVRGQRSEVRGRHTDRAHWPASLDNQRTPGSLRDSASKKVEGDWWRHLISTCSHYMYT